MTIGNKNSSKNQFELPSVSGANGFGSNIAADDKLVESIEEKPLGRLPPEGRRKCSAGGPGPQWVRHGGSKGGNNAVKRNTSGRFSFLTQTV